MTTRRRDESDAVETGRRALLDWRDSQPTNVYLADDHFRSVLGHYAGSALGGMADDLERFGAEVAGIVGDLVCENNLHANLPRLERFDGVGQRQEQIVHHPTYHQAGRYIYGSGVMEAYAEPPNSLGALARFYLSSYNGEAGHNCPLACTAGVIRVLQELGDDELKRRYLPGLLDRRYGRHLEGAQFLTEVQGGSDVGANSCRAEPQPDGSWRLYGEKWFCSNIDADLFLMTARPAGASTGTKDLGLFLAPRTLEDGRPNAFTIRRLKDKLGTRSMASAECDFDGAVATHMGPVGSGFVNMMRLVINTSRLYNAVGCTGISRRSFVTARTYAEHRTAFGQAIIDYPLVAEHLADMRAELDLMVSGTFHSVWTQDRIDGGRARDADPFHRLAVNLNKMRTAKSARWMVVQGIEVLGGNGAIESFSVLPRLLRDVIVFENWEGSHNTLLMQIYRDMQRYDVHIGFFDYLGGLLETDGVCAHRGAELRVRLHDIASELDSILGSDRDAASLRLRPLLDDLGHAYHAVVRLHEMALGTASGPLNDAILEQFFEHRLRPARTYGAACLDRTRLIARA